MVQSSFLWTAAVLLTVFSSPSHAERPAGKFGGHQQMNIDQLEKDLGNKFTIPFPSKRYGIDYFYKGDLVVRKNAEVSVAATCPYVLKNLVAFGLGVGETSEDYQMKTEVDLDSDDSGNPFRITLRKSFQGEWPKNHLSLSRKDGEDTKTFIQRIERSVLESAETSKQVKTSRNLAQLALQVIRAVTKQNLDLE